MTGGWALARGTGWAWGALRDAWRSLPREAWRAWGAVLVGGGLLCAAATAGITLLARARLGAGLQTWDAALLDRVVTAGPLAFDAAIWWEAFGASSMLIPVVLGAAGWALWAGRPLLCLTFAAAYLLAKPIVLVGWQVWDRARPTVVLNGIAAPPLHSFPSGHAVQTAAIYGLILFLWMRASGSVVERVLVAVLWAALLAMVCLARLRLGTHWPSDVLAGALIGTILLAVLALALGAAEARGGR